MWSELRTHSAKVQVQIHMRFVHLLPLRILVARTPYVQNPAMKTNIPIKVSRLTKGASCL